MKLLAFALLAALPLHAAPKKYPYMVTTTVGMVNDIVRNVAGDKAKVTALMGAGVDPHLYKPTRDDVTALLGADVVFYSGLMLEGKLADTLIAQCCIDADIPLIAHDRGFRHFATHCGLQLAV